MRVCMCVCVCLFVRNICHLHASFYIQDTHTQINQIIEPTSNKHGESVFTSILFAPKPEHSFEEYLDKMKAHKIPLLMLYGKEDPWVSSCVCVCVCVCVLELGCCFFIPFPFLSLSLPLAFTLIYSHIHTHIHTH